MNLFTEYSIQFDNKNLNIGVRSNLPAPTYYNENIKFGILSFKAISCNVTDLIQEFVFNVDCSGSMSDRCSDRRTKMQHILHTLKNMINYLHSNSIKAFITIFAFDDSIHSIFKRTNITNDNYNQIIDKIDKIVPMGGTNIEIALKNTKEYIDDLIQKFPHHNINQIFLTDGEATVGTNDYSVLRSYIPKTSVNSFIGFGIDHDSALLNSISSDNNSSYHFIDKIENAGLVYGEILYGILYKLLSNVELHIVGGLIYNYKSNLWTDKLYIGDIVGETNKIYHIVSENPIYCHAKLLSINNIININICLHINNNLINIDLTKYVFRQRTLQFLYESNELNTEFRKRNHFDFFYNTIENDNSEETNKKTMDIKEKKKLFKDKLKKYILEMKQYMTDNGLTDDSFMKNLCDDIYIVYRTFGTEYGNMYSCARQTSQGTQRCYTVSQTPDDIEDTQHLNSTIFTSPTRPVGPRNTFASNALRIRRQYDFDSDNDSDNDNNNNNNNNNNCDNNDDLNHVISNLSDSPYLTPSATQVMNSVNTRIHSNHNKIVTL